MEEKEMRGGVNMEVGKVQSLRIRRFKPAGAYLGEADSVGGEGDVLLPKKQVPENAQLGDELEVFIYRDSSDRMIATTRRPLLQVGEMGFLPVKEKLRFGYFLDWGLEKDVFLPFAETIGHLEVGRRYLVRLYVDKSGRISATMKIKEFLSEMPPYQENDMVQGVIYSISKGLGAFIAVDGKYDGLLPEREMQGVFEIGEELSLRVRSVKDDGKLDLTLRERSHLQMDKDAQRIFEKLRTGSGYLPLSDKSDAKVIEKTLGMSKSAFKRAIGRLYKERLILIEEDGISLTEEDKNGK